jgi:hypothetical protein
MHALPTKLLAAAALVAATAGTAAAFDPIPAADVPGLAGTKAYIEVPVEVRHKKPKFATRRLFTGEEVTIKGRERGQIDAWLVVTDKDGQDWEIMLENLSRTQPAYSMLATGTLEEFVASVFAEAFATQWKLTDLWQAHDYDLSTDGATRDQRTALEDALRAHRSLLDHVVHGRESKSQVLGDESKKWLWTADPSVLETYCEGMEYLDQWKKSDLLKRAERASSLLGSAENAADAAGEISRLKDELKRKPWRGSVNREAPPALVAAMDKDEVASREKRVKELEGRIAEAREKAGKGAKL